MRSRTSSRSRSTAARRPSGPREALNARFPRDLAVVRAERGARRFQRSLLGPRRAPIATASGAERERSPFEVRRSLWHPAPARSRPARSARPRCSSASTTSAPSRRPRRSTRTFVRTVVEARAGSARGDALEFEITANSFLRHMVRTLVGTMLERDPDELDRPPRGPRGEPAGRRRPRAGT